jgi:DNA-damage-inducible protein J
MGVKEMIREATVRARVDKQLKIDVEDVLNQLGLSLSEAICLYMAQIRLNKGIPFDLKVPNRTTQKVFQDTDKGHNLVRCKDAEDMFKNLGI